MLFAVFNRRESNELIEVFKNRLEIFDSKVLRKAFDSCESELEKFPTVKYVLGLCYQDRPSTAWRYNYQPGYDDQGMPCLHDPDPDCDVCREPRSKHPHATCKAMVDGKDARNMYRPQDCPEGRAFLALLAKMASEQRTPQVDLEQSRKNIQAQAIAITKHYREPGEEG
jgi:hypothetical protein